MAEVSNHRISDDQLEQQMFRAKARALDRRAEEPFATRAEYNTEYQRVEVELSNGFSFAFPPSLFDDLAQGTGEQLLDLQVDPSGYGLHWRQLDADYDLAGLVQAALGAKHWMSVRELGRLGGQATSPAKRAAAIANGLKGGRPPKDRDIAAFPLRIRDGERKKATKGARKAGSKLKPRGNKAKRPSRLAAKR